MTPERVASYLLSTLRQTAERHLVAPVRMAVISVPAEFGEMERNATVEAARLAGGCDFFDLMNLMTSLSRVLWQVWKCCA